MGKRVPALTASESDAAPAQALGNPRFQRTGAKASGTTRPPSGKAGNEGGEIRKENRMRTRIIKPLSKALVPLWGFGLALVSSVVLFLIVMAFTLVQLRASKRRVQC
jgi:hypothetical protein